MLTNKELLGSYRVRALYANDQKCHYTCIAAGINPNMYKADYHRTEELYAKYSEKVKTEDDYADTRKAMTEEFMKLISEELDVIKVMLRIALMQSRPEGHPFPQKQFRNTMMNIYRVVFRQTFP